MDMDDLGDDIDVKFREVRLPRPVEVDYPREPEDLLKIKKAESEILVACMGEEPIGYIRLNTGAALSTAWVTDMAVIKYLRRQGVGSSLLLAGRDWAAQKNSRRIILEMQSKNYPAIGMAKKLGFDFCGFSDRYYPNHDIAVFFAYPLR
jgi:ribosomal protein S18 acetylase RimI-like enzyme